MAASSLLLRSLQLASSGRVLHKAGAALYPTTFLCYRAETLNLRGSLLACRSFSAQALEVSEPVLETRSSKKKKFPASSWEEAGATFFSKKGKNAAENGTSVEQRDEKKGFSARESVQSRPSQRYAEEEPVVNRNFERKNDRGPKAFNEGKFSNSRNAPRDFGRGREGFTGRDGGFARRQSADMDSGRGAYRGRGFREEFSGVGEDRRPNRWNGRNDSDGRNRWNARSDADGRNRWNSRSDAESRNGWNARSDAVSGGFRKDISDRYADDKPAPRSEGAFRKEFGDSVDTSKGFFRSRNQGGAFGKKQFPDADGGKRMFNGRFQGDGFVKKQIRSDERGEDDDSKKSSYGAMKRGQSFSKGSTRTLVPKQIEDDLEAEVTSEDDEDESEDFPQAGDVIRYNELVSTNRESNREQSPVDSEDSEDEAQVEPDEDDDDYEDENAQKRRDFGYVKRELPVMSSSLPKLVGEVVYGVGPVYAALQVSRREFYCLYVQQNMPIGGGNAGKKKDKKAVEWIIRTAIDKGLEVKEISKHDLNMLADNRPHQGLILDASPLELVVSTHLEPSYAENGKTPVWVALDEVTDPQNFGAILRSAYFLGAKGVVVCAKNSAPLSAVVSKASAGALEVMELRSCKNMMKFLDRSTENGWRVVGGSAAGSDVTCVRELPRGLPTILVLGGEGKGLRTNVKRSCSELVCIPGLASETQEKRGGVSNNVKVEEADNVDAEDSKRRSLLRGSGENFIAVESLNVSVAAGILLHELLNNQAATKVSKHSEIDEEAVLGDEQELHSEINVVMGDDQEQQSESGVEVALSDEVEHHSESDVEAVLIDGQEQHPEIDVKAGLSDEQEQSSRIAATD